MSLLDFKKLLRADDDFVTQANRGLQETLVEKKEKQNKQNLKEVLKRNIKYE